eukprot:jgi/Pico_ML_1/50529/g1720.t1
MIDQVQRMKEIAYVLELEDPPEGYTEEQFVDAKAELLEEMQDLVESIDNAKDLKGMALEGGALQQVLKLLEDPVAICRTKDLGMYFDARRLGMGMVEYTCVPVLGPSE